MQCDATVVIPNWNGAGRLTRAIRSVQSQTCAPKEILVVDDGSTDGSYQEATAAGTLVLRFDKNSGFSRAVNAGVGECSTHWVAIVNNDVELAPTWLENLMAGCGPDVAYASGKILKANDRTVIDGTYDLLSWSGCAWRAGHGAPENRFNQARDVHFVPLTAALVRRDVFLRMGGLDVRFESYLEDIDFCLTCALAGLRGRYVPQAVAYHEGSASLGAWSPRMVELLARNQVFLVAKHFPNPVTRAVLVGQLLWGLLARKRGTGRAWFSGKRRGLASFRAMRASKMDAARLAIILQESEEEIRRLQTNQPDTFWEQYFRWRGR
ncbi:glycosyltransferase family 2 protein [uncultured Paludibaculum sp.]|uniref:glycosyltransferase family 2 protein n=1 Tax=uncultured Paludibaculum sp. TaxID=1765020 RepID=UPI002AAAC4DF|nr:glycosyltransferase family 2 protein [uncultured Paludibaculum sp.]